VQAGGELVLQARHLAAGENARELGDNNLNGYL
jgi:hypothetical protein